MLFRLKEEPSLSQWVSNKSQLPIIHHNGGLFHPKATGYLLRDPVVLRRHIAAVLLFSRLHNTTTCPTRQHKKIAGFPAISLVVLFCRFIGFFRGSFLSSFGLEILEKLFSQGLFLSGA